MYKLLFTITFMAELVLATAIISKICHLNRYINNLNGFILANKNFIKINFTEIRRLLKSFTSKLYDIKGLIIRKRNEHIVNFLKTITIYCGIFFLRGKYKKAILAYQLIKEIYQGISEAEA